MAQAPLPEAGPSNPAPAKQPKPAAQPSSSADPKGKSAKDLKKEARAARVAARPSKPPSDDPVPSVPAPTPGAHGRVPPQHASAPAAAQAGPSSSHPGKRPPLAAAVSFDPNPQAHFFAHLPTHRTPHTPALLQSGRVHPVVLRLGLLMADGALRGANARTMAMMAAFQEVIRDYQCPEQAVLWKDLPVHLSPMIAYLEDCRPKGVGGGNAIRWLKGEINKLGEVGGGTEAEQKHFLIEAIEVYVRDRIEFADKVIANLAKEKIQPGDTVIIYARSSVVERVLFEAWREMRLTDPTASFDVVVVDSRPLLEGQHALAALSSAGISCTYTLLPLLSSLIRRASLVLLGASALHSDGALYSRAGTALLAMLAKEHRVPVVACCETYKFGERVVLDGVAANELGEDGLLGLVGGAKGKGAKAGKGEVQTLSLMYDLTPPALITAVCTEIGFIPPSSVPTVLGKASGVI